MGFSLAHGLQCIAGMTTQTHKHPAANGGKWIRPDKRLAIYLRDDCACIYCGRTMEEGLEPSLDHVKPHVFGGTNDESNLVTCCRSCNSSKQDLSVREFAARLEEQGVDTSKLGARIRRNTRRKLRRYRKLAKAMIAGRK